MNTILDFLRAKALEGLTLLSLCLLCLGTASSNSTFIVAVVAIVALPAVAGAIIATSVSVESPATAFLLLLVLALVFTLVLVLVLEEEEELLRTVVKIGVREGASEYLWRGALSACIAVASYSYLIANRLFPFALNNDVLALAASTRLLPEIIPFEFATALSRLLLAMAYKNSVYLY